MAYRITGRLAAAALVTSSFAALPTVAVAAPGPGQAHCQGADGCLLPLAPRAVVAQPAPVYSPPVATPVQAAPVAAEATGRGFPYLIVLGALAAAGAILAIVLSNNNNNNNNPVSP